MTTEAENRRGTEAVQARKLARNRDNDPQQLATTRRRVKMGNLMGLGGNSCMLLSPADRSAIDTCYRRVSTVLKDRHRHSSRSTYRDRSLLHLLILRVMQVPISFSRRGETGNALMNFDTFHGRQFKVAARTMNTHGCFTSFLL